MRCNAIWGQYKRSQEVEISNVDNTIKDTEANFSKETEITTMRVDDTTVDEANDGYGGIVSSYYEQYKQGVQ